MTAKEIIALTNDLRANLISDAQKLSWIYVLEKQITEHMSRFGEKDVHIESIDESSVLSLGEEYRDMYVYHVVSMIDLANQDIAMYNNSCAFFNEMFDSWLKKWRREHQPMTVQRGNLE